MEHLFRQVKLPAEGRDRVAGAVLQEPPTGTGGGVGAADAVADRAAAAEAGRRTQDPLKVHKQNARA